MKCALLIFASFIAISYTAYASPRLPSTVRALQPKGAISLKFFRLAPAPKSPQLLVHLWTTPRRNSLRYDTKQYPVNSPFVFDVFTDEQPPKYRTSFIYAASRTPNKISLRYLNSKTKKGLVFEMIENGLSDGWAFNYTSTFFTFPFWPGISQSSQIFKSDVGSAGNYHAYHVGRNANGMLQIIYDGHDSGSPIVVHEVSIWDRRHFLFIAPKSKTDP
ncbi:hypothetical protein IAD21_02685 [Abditibacteriota bacterium]|nr:hypothetical protein IAD21_02685 [Abditibacteriota bacterium]